MSNIFIGDSSVNYTSPGYPMPYLNDLDCQWVIVAMEERIIVARIKDFMMENRYDFLEIGQGEEVGAKKVGRVSGMTALRSFTSLGESNLWLRLVTDATGNMRGFHLEIGSEDESNSLYGKCKIDVQFSGIKIISINSSSRDYKVEIMVIRMME